MNRHERRAEKAAQRRLSGRRTSALAERPCGGCTVCCTLKAIGELRKPAGQPCPHIAPDGRSCLVHGRHPASCRSYGCAWRQGFLSDEARPDRCGVLWEQGRTVLVPGVPVIVATEAREGALQEAAEILATLAEKFIVVKIRGKERSAMGPPRIMCVLEEGLRGTDHIQVE
jgi:Fe-S-cluster containining protein